MVPEVLPIAEFRANLASYLKSVASDRRKRLYVGARRVPEAVVMSPAADVPPRILDRLLSAFMIRAAEHIIEDSASMGTVVVDNAGGEVFSWLWLSDPNRAVSHMAELMAQIHIHHRDANPHISFSDVVDAFEAVMPHDFPSTEYKRFAAQCREQAPKYYSGINGS